MLRQPHQPFGRPAKLAATLILSALCAALIPLSPLMAYVLIAASLLAAIYQGFQWWREREDPYDLSRIWDPAPDPEIIHEDDGEPGLALCSRCGTASSPDLSLCPECGSPRGLH